MASIAPAPAQTPSIAAMIGCGQARIAETSAPVMRVKLSSPSNSPSSCNSTSGPMTSCMSAPAQKFPPAPVSTMAFTSDMLGNAWNTVASSRNAANVRAFSTSGRSSVIVATRSATLHPKCSGRNSAPGAGPPGGMTTFTEGMVEGYELASRLCVEAGVLYVRSSDPGARHGSAGRHQRVPAPPGRRPGRNGAQTVDPTAR